MVLVEVDELRKVYSGRAVVDGVSFTVSEGEIFGVLGPNGAGKTTTVECISGLRRPDGGRIRVQGLDPEQEVRSRRGAAGVETVEVDGLIAAAFRHRASREGAVLLAGRQGIEP